MTSLPRKRRKTASAQPAVDLSPARYIAAIDAITSEEIEGAIAPEELLVHAHRDRHPVEIALQFAASRAIQLTRNERRVRQGLRLLNTAGDTLAGSIGFVTGSAGVERRTRKLLGVVQRERFLKFREPTHLSDREVRTRIQQLQKAAGVALRKRGNPRLHVLLTGATGFVGKEILAQAASDPRIESVVCVVRPETIRDSKTKEVLRVLSPAERGALLLKRLGIAGRAAEKFAFVEGDIEKPGFGLARDELARLRRSLTHVIHCAASVAFDDPYEASVRANVLGSLNALEFSLGVQNAPGSAFVHHVAIETSYIHGRRKSAMAAESALVFPRHFYNNFYELTKAMASIETDRAMVERGLRVVQLLPSIVIGDSHTGNNRGDTKVVNAPINAFGRIKEALDASKGGPAGRVRATLVALVANGFPGDPSAELNLVPVDRVVSGILASLTRPEAIGHRIHLATDNRIRSADIVRIAREELGVNTRLADPTLYRNLTLPLVKAVLSRMNEPKMASALEKLGTIFGAYNEWGQPVHEVGNDVRILSLPIHRPDTQAAFRMLCRHNKYVQEFGRVRDPDEIARREGLWRSFVDKVEHRTGREAAYLDPKEFRQMLAAELDLHTFEARKAPKPAARPRPAASA